MSEIKIHDVTVLNAILKCYDNILEENIEDILAKAGNPEVTFEHVRHEIERFEKIKSLFRGYYDCRKET